MKKPIFVLCLFVTLHGAAAVRDSTFRRHQFSFSMTNGLSAVLENPRDFGTPDGGLETAYFPYTLTNGNGLDTYIPVNTSYLPDYSLQVRCEYSRGFSKVTRLETGIGYLMQGLIIKYNFEGGLLTSTTNFYFGSLTVPMHIKLRKAMRHGAFTCAFGPDIMLPVHEFWRTGEVKEGGKLMPAESGHRHFSPRDIATNSNLGFEFKMGWEKQLNQNLSVNIGPIMTMMELLDFYQAKLGANGQIPDILQSYIGFDVAVNFGMR